MYPHNIGDGKVNTPLHHAARLEDLDMVRLLLESNADPHRLNDEGVSPVLQTAPAVQPRCRQCMRCLSSPSTATLPRSVVLHLLCTLPAGPFWPSTSHTLGCSHRANQVRWAASTERHSYCWTVATALRRTHVLEALLQFETDPEQAHCCM